MNLSIMIVSHNPNLHNEFVQNFTLVYYRDTLNFSPLTFHFKLALNESRQHRKTSNRSAAGELFR